MKKERVRTTKGRTQQKKQKAAPLSRSAKKPASASSKKNFGSNKATERIKKAIRVVVPPRFQSKIIAKDINGKTFFVPGEDYKNTPLPFSYNETRLVLLVRDPEWAFGYWDFSATTWDWLTSLMKSDGGTRGVLRIYNIDETTQYDIHVDLEAKNWYLKLHPEHSFEAELGLIDSQGRFYSIARSNRIRTPRLGPSKIIDQAWEALDFDEIYRLSGGHQNNQSGSSFASSFMKQKQV